MYKQSIFIFRGDYSGSLQITERLKRKGFRWS